MFIAIGYLLVGHISTCISHLQIITEPNGILIVYILLTLGDRGSTVVKVLHYKSEGR
jgi:hypothetical protein